MEKKLEFVGKLEKGFAGILGAVVGTTEKIFIKLHADAVFPAASLIKIPVLISLLQENDARSLDLAEVIHLRREDRVGGSGVLIELHDGIPLTFLDLANVMITVSDNIATNLLIDRLGMKKIQASIKQAGLKKTVLTRKILGTPEATNVNFTTPWDMFVLLKQLESGSLLSPRNTELALQILFRQQYNEKIPRFLPKEVRVAHKTGEVSGARHDCGIIQNGGQRWIACFLTKQAKDELQADDLISGLALECHKFFSKRPGGAAKRGK